MKKIILSLFIILSVSVLLINAHRENIVGSFWTRDGKRVEFLCSGKVRGLGDFVGFRQSDENTLTLYTKDGSSCMCDFVISFDKKRIYLSGKCLDRFSFV